MEWSGEQQLGFLLRSAAVGIGIGLLFDVISGFWRGKKYRRQLYAADAILGVVAALITFFGALIIMDGQLHPVLFCGVLLGMLSEHYIVGRWLSFFLWKLRMVGLRFRVTAVLQMKDLVHKWVANPIHTAYKCRKSKKNTEKPEKN